MSELTPEEEAALKSFLSWYEPLSNAGKVGKFLAIAAASILGFIVLASQAWDVVKLKLGFH